MIQEVVGVETISESLVKTVIQKRPAISHKGNFGHVTLIGGDAHYGGAIIMATESCILAGAGLTTVVTASPNHAPLHTRRPEAMVVDWQDFAAVEQAIETADVVLAGPGLGETETARKLLNFLLQKRRPEQWLILDGSALTLLAATSVTKLAEKLRYPETVVLTPHQMEWQRLSKIPIKEQSQENNQKIQALIGGTIVVKSHRTEIYGHHQMYQNPLGNPGMATGGTGDTLAGLIAAFLGQFPKNSTTIAAAVYLHSKIGDALYQSDYVVLPTKLSSQLPKWMKHYEEQN